MEEENKENLLKSIIYYIMAIGTDEERNVDAIIRFLSINRELMRNFEEQFPKDHISYKHYMNIDSLTDDEYSSLTKSLVLMIVFGLVEQRYEYMFPEFEDENDVDKYVKNLLKK